VNKLRGVAGILRRRFIRAVQKKRAVRARSQGTYRSSRETAARTLRQEDARLLGTLAEGQQPGSSMIDYRAQR
jgi:hypothetical protein